MATANESERNQRASAWSARYTDGVITISAGATALATHTLAGFGAPSSGVLTANAIPNVTIANTGTADTAILSDGADQYTLVIGTDIILSTTNYVQGETSMISSMTVTFPA